MRLKCQAGRKGTSATGCAASSARSTCSRRSPRPTRSGCGSRSWPPARHVEEHRARRASNTHGARVCRRARRGTRAPLPAGPHSRPARRPGARPVRPARRRAAVATGDDRRDRLDVAGRRPRRGVRRNARPGRRARGRPLSEQPRPPRAAALLGDREGAPLSPARGACPRDHRPHRTTRRTATTITDVEQLLRELESVRAKGFAVDDEEDSEGVFCVGSSVFDHQQACVAAISVTGLKLMLPAGGIDGLGGVVCRYAAEISVRLGAVPVRLEPHVDHL